MEIAWGLIERGMLASLSGQKCEECSGEVIDAGEELVCSACGVVSEKEVVEVMPAPPVQAIDFTGQALGGYLGHIEPTEEERRAPGLSGSKTSYRYMKLISDFTGREDSALYSCAKLIERVCDNLSLPGTVMREAVVMARKLMSSPVRMKVGSAAISAYAVITACKIVGATSVGTREVLDAHRVLGRRVSISALIQLSLDSPFRPPSRKPQDYLGRIVAKLSFDPGLARELGAPSFSGVAYFRRLQDGARDTLARIDDIAMAGHNPCALAATAVYSTEVAMSRREGRKTWLSQRDLAGCAGVAEYTVREQYRKIFKPVLALRDPAELRTPALRRSS